MIILGSTLSLPASGPSSRGEQKLKVGQASSEICGIQEVSIGAAIRRRDLADRLRVVKKMKQGVGTEDGEGEPVDSQ